MSENKNNSDDFSSISESVRHEGKRVNHSLKTDNRKYVPPTVSNLSGNAANNNSKKKNGNKNK